MYYFSFSVVVLPVLVNKDEYKNTEDINDRKGLRFVTSLLT